MNKTFIEIIFLFICLNINLFLAQKYVIRLNQRPRYRIHNNNNDPTVLRVYPGANLRPNNNYEEAGVPPVRSPKYQSNASPNGPSDGEETKIYDSKPKEDSDSYDKTDDKDMETFSDESVVRIDYLINL